MVEHESQGVLTQQVEEGTDKIPPQIMQETPNHLISYVSALLSSLRSGC